MPSAVCFLLLLPLLALLPKPGSCSCGDAFQLQCHSSDHCVWIWEICDGINDCEDNSDEEEGLCRLRGVVDEATRRSGGRQPRHTFPFHCHCKYYFAPRETSLLTMPHVSFDSIYDYLMKGVWPPSVCTKGEKANFRKACRPFAVKDEELFYKKVKNDETGEKVEAWKTNECAAHRARCTRHGGSRCLPISLYCLSKDPPCKGTLDRRVCVPTVLPFTNQSRQEMEEWAEHFEHKLSLTISHPDCPKLYTRVGSLCLSVFFMVTMDWLEARTFCRTIGGHLLTLGQDAAAYATLLQHLAASGVTDDFWIGGRRFFNETGWQWLDDTPVQMGFPYWAVRHEAHCRPRTLPDLDNQTTLANDGACYLYQQAPPRSTHRHCLAATFRHYWHLSDEDCGDKKSPLCVRPEERKEEKQAI
ncbi:uncharacterized protein LOC127003122 [Eriocheir sinensis]|uniref:uncharacterized protein LOC127003122 n=1 Tax=Eriocheir sinensis TaxID=95602 RepID=UPI0021C88B0C|nr:uncharacterized protein LOC127003122 [Eriocheir sinensis]